MTAFNVHKISALRHSYVNANEVTKWPLPALTYDCKGEELSTADPDREQETEF